MALIGSTETFFNIRQALHSLAQPLSVLVGTIDMLLMEMDEADPRRPVILRVNDQLERVLQIVGEIREMARRATRTESGRSGSVATPEL